MSDPGTWEHAQRRDFDFPGVRQLLDAAPLSSIEAWFGQPSIATSYAEPMAWSVGDGRPGLADEDPAVMQALGRCAASRVRSDLPGIRLGVGRVHPRPCGWCGLPLAELLRACDWAVWRSRFLLAEVLTWHSDPVKRPGAEYHRVPRSDVYTQPDWADFWALPTDRRESRIQAAQYPSEDQR